MLCGLCVYVCLYVGHKRDSCKNSWTDCVAVWVVDLGGPKWPCVSWGDIVPPIINYRQTLRWTPENGWPNRHAVWLWTVVGTRNHVLGGSPDNCRGRGNFWGLPHLFIYYHIVHEVWGKIKRSELTEKHSIINIHKDSVHTCTTTSYSTDRKLIILGTWSFESAHLGLLSLSHQSTGYCSLQKYTLMRCSLTVWLQ